ncbi:DUF6470 family protein, partial [Tepidanaerobacter acetatoxydans]|uniref:DUF6470 family protein n=1 Tax=Tepidanaerobacter acetatoxydans TaxID=499229 RepID=UPI00235B6C5F
MPIYDIDIQFEFGKIGIDTHNASIDTKMDIQQQGVEIKTQSSDFSVANTFPIIEDIDCSHCRTDMGYPQPLVASGIWRDEAKQYVMEYLSSKSAGGDALGAI